jgi:DNA repair photolyase
MLEPPQTDWEDDIPFPDSPRKGRGAVTNRTGRFEGYVAVPVADGWDSWDEDLPPLRTTLTADATRTIIARNESPDVPFDRSINPYRGCEHGCVYCFARPTHAVLGLSPGLDFESLLFYKPDAPSLLEKELRSPKYECDVMAMGTNTDPYQPVERELMLTRRILEVLAAHDHPVGIVTKSSQIVRDIDILAPMAAKGLARVCISITTLDRGLARTMEPRAPTPARRLETIKALSDASIPCGVMTAPLIPVLNDPELESILEAATAAGADMAGYVLLRLPLEIKDLFREWLEAHYPLKAKHVMNAMRETRGGQIYDPTYGLRQRGTGPYAALLQQRFEKACKRLGLNDRKYRLDTTKFKRPPRKGDQLGLF